MQEIRNILIGFDFGKDSSQICYYNRQLDEPASLIVKVGEEDAAFSNCVSTADGEKWHFGPEAEFFSARQGETLIDDLYGFCLYDKKIVIGGKIYGPGELLAVFIRESLQLLRVKDPLEKISSFMLTTPRVTKNLVDHVRRAFSLLGFESGRCGMQDYGESFYFETYSDKLERRGRKAGLFAFEDNEVTFKCLDVDQTVRPAPVKCRVGRSISLPEDEMQKDLDFYNLISSSLGNDIYSTIYLVGDGFSQDWAKKSVPLLCKAPRKVYVGSNLYARGACLAAREKVEGKRIKSYRYVGGDVVLYDIGMELLINGVASYYPMITGGENWYDSDTSCEILLDEEDSIRLLIGEVNEKEKKVIVMKLDGLPKRPPKASRVRVELGFISASVMKVKITDLGFGDLYPSSGKVWEETLNEQGGGRS